MTQTRPPTPELREAHIEAARHLMGYLDQSPTPYHATENLREMFLEAGFEELDEGAPFCIEPEKRYIVRRGDSALVAFVVGTRPPNKSGFRIVGAHTDSPALRLKPKPESMSSGLIHLGVEVYGGPILATWTDRDLGLAGRVMLHRPGGSLERRLYRSESPVVCMPNVAIHQNRGVNEEGLKLNPQTELTPILGMNSGQFAGVGGVKSLISRALKVKPDEILDFDLVLYDTQPASLCGASQEFLCSGRIDDLAMCHAALTALVADQETPTRQTRVAVFYDSEEIGSLTREGARSTMLPATLERICLALGSGRDGFYSSLANSFLVSADNAHARHPGYAGKMDPNHAPLLNKGPVIKMHAGRAYSTDAASAAQFALWCKEAGVPTQRFVNRSDVKSGGTIGSMTATQLGIQAVDVGNAQYAMHSVREMTGTLDHLHMIHAMRASFTA